MKLHLIYICIDIFESHQKQIINAHELHHIQNLQIFDATNLKLLTVVNDGPGVKLVFLEQVIEREMLGSVAGSVMGFKVPVG